MTERKPGAAEDSLVVSRRYVMEALDIGDTTLDYLCATGELVKLKIGKRALITRDSFTAYVERLRAEAAQRQAEAEAERAAREARRAEIRGVVSAEADAARRANLAQAAQQRREAQRLNAKLAQAVRDSS